MADRDRVCHEGVVHAVADSEHWRSRCWTWCDLRLDWGDRAGALTEETGWPTNERPTCFLCIARMR